MRDNRCPECDNGAIIVAYKGKMWMECASKTCDWCTIGCPVLPSLEVNLDHLAMGYLAPGELAQVIYAEIEKKEEDKYATVEDVFGVLESVNENRRNIQDLTIRVDDLAVRARDLEEWQKKVKKENRLVKKKICDVTDRIIHLKELVTKSFAMASGRLSSLESGLSELYKKKMMKPDVVTKP
jgi:hypothetical protein